MMHYVNVLQPMPMLAEWGSQFRFGNCLISVGQFVKFLLALFVSKGSKPLKYLSGQSNLLLQYERLPESFFFFRKFGDVLLVIAL